MRSFVVYFLLSFSFCVYAQNAGLKKDLGYKLNEEVIVQTICKTQNDLYFDTALKELSLMMTNQTNYSFKRAVFLWEWAYNRGESSYSDFCNQINEEVKKLRNHIHINNYSKYKTAPNAVLFEFFTKPSWLNGGRVFEYDFDDPYGKNDYRHLFVSTVLKRHLGQCLSLPLTYKVLCDELNGQSYLALAPKHSYIKHLGEDGKWWNLELTNGSYSRDEWIIKTMGVSLEAVRSGIFLTSLSEKENIAHIICLLSNAYKRRYGSYDLFTLKCADTVLKHLPNFAQALVIKFNTIQSFGFAYQARWGNEPSDFLFSNYEVFKQLMNKLDSLGYTQMTDEEYCELLSKYSSENEASKVNRFKAATIDFHSK